MTREVNEKVTCDRCKGDIEPATRTGWCWRRWTVVQLTGGTEFNMDTKIKYEFDDEDENLGMVAAMALSGMLAGRGSTVGVEFAAKLAWDYAEAWAAEGQKRYPKQPTRAKWRCQQCGGYNGTDQKLCERCGGA